MKFCDYLFNSCVLKKEHLKRYAKAERRIERELDIGTFIRRQKRQLLAFKTIFTKMERYLLQNQSTFVLGSENCGSDSSESDIISPWEENQPWNKQKTRYFKSLLRGTRLVKDDTDDEVEKVQAPTGKSHVTPKELDPSLNVSDDSNLITQPKQTLEIFSND